MSGNTSLTLVEQHKKKVELRAWKTHEEKSIVKDIELGNFMPKEDKELDKNDVKPLLHLVDRILNRAIRNVNSTVMEDEDYMELETHRYEVIRTRERFNYKLDKIAYEIAYDISSKADLHYTVLSIFKILGDHRWEDKLILCLTAFALNYGDCWHLALKHSSNLLGELMKQVPDIRKQPSHDALQEVNDLVRATMDVMKCVIDFQKVQGQVDADKSPQEEEAYKILDNKISIPVTIYWSIKSVLVCASMITRFITMDLKYSVSDIEIKELNRLTKKLQERKQDLQVLKNTLDSNLVKKKASKTVETIKSLLEFPQVDNMNILRALLTHGRDPQPLVKDNKKVDLEDLRKQMVLLLISDLDISGEDIAIIEDINSKSRAKTKKRQNELEIVWLPMIDRKGNDDDKKFDEKKREMMKWYTVNEPSLISDQVKNMADLWKFKGEPIIVVIDKQGQVACPDAFPMIRIWGYDAYPFTILKEKDLWMDKSCNLELLFSADRHPQIQELIKPGKESKCLFGGEDMEWIKMFTTRAPSVAEAAKAPLQMLLYVGTPKPNKRTRRITKTIESEFHENDQMKFWKRLKNLAHSKMQLGETIYEDPVLQDIVLIHNLGSSGDGWAVLCCGLDIKIIAKGEKILHSLVNFSEWKDKVKESESSSKTSTPSEVEEDRKESSGFIHALEQHLTMYPYAIDHDKSYEDIFDNKVKGLDILKIFVSAKDNWQPLINGSTRERVNVDHLKNKKLLLLISDCNISQEELAPLKHMYTESQKGTGKDKSTYEMVWLPIKDPTTPPGHLVVNQKIEDPTTLQQEFKKKQEQMPWYYVYELSMINEAAIRFVKQFWHYDGRTIVVVLNQNGMVECVQALRKVAIWLQKVISNPSSTEEALWANMECSLDLIIDDLHPKIKEWKNEDPIICIYGGGDTEFPQKLRQRIETIKISPMINLKMLILYVGKCNLSHQGSSELEKLDKTLVQLFWYRLKSMWISKYEMGNKEDNIMKMLSQLLGFDSSGSGWAIMGKNRGTVVIAKENDLLDSLSNYEKWKEQADGKGFLQTLQKKLQEIETPCLKFTLPEFAENKRVAVGCSQMQRFFTFKCC